MIHKTQGIVFKITNYSESSIVAQIFTRKLGLQSYLINGVRKSKSAYPQSFFQPLHLLEMVVHHKESGGLQRISELKNIPIFLSIPYDIQKTSMVLFINEILCKTITHDLEDEQLFDFLYHAILWLDLKEKVSANFHLSFLLKFTKYLGFQPSFNKEEANKYFDLTEGKYLTSEPIHPHYLDSQNAAILELLYRYDFDELENSPLSNEQRRILLYKILDYYYLHVNTAQKLKSLVILEQLFS